MRGFTLNESLYQTSCALIDAMMYIRPLTSKEEKIKNDCLARFNKENEVLGNHTFIHSDEASSQHDAQYIAQEWEMLA